MFRRGIVLTLGVLLVSRAVSSETVRLAPGPEYAAGRWHRFWFGSGYRDLWTTPATVPVLDLATEAGGLTPVRQVGQFQTPGLALTGADGRSYTFRGLHKEPERSLPVEWRRSWPGKIWRDQTSATHPAAAIILPVLADAAGVPNSHPRLVFLPDDPALGAFRKTFGGTMGTFEVYPTAAAAGVPGFREATEILSSSVLWERWLQGPENRIDSAAMLRARILDLFVHNYDRHKGQWRWTHTPGRTRFEPLPEDPDMCFLKHDGFILGKARAIEPTIELFQDRYPRRLSGMMTNGAEMDRWLLTDLDRAAFRQAAEELQARFTDAVIEKAVRAMPPEWYAIDGERLAAALRIRRDGLVDYIDRVYLHLAHAVDVQATDRDELVRVRRRSDGAVEVSVALTGDEETSPYFRRLFVPRETNEIRIYLRGGNDRTVVDGGRGPIDIRVIAGPGQDTIDDRLGGAVDVWPGEGRVDVQRGPGTHERRGVWTHPKPVAGAPWQEPRSVGHWTVAGTNLWVAPDLDVLFGASLNRTAWGFRKYPRASLHSARALFSTAERRGRIEYSGTFHRVDSPLSTRLLAHASGIDHVNFYGYGNETAPTDRVLRRTKQNNVSLAPMLRYEPGPSVALFAGVEGRWSDSSRSAATVLGQNAPYGTGQFGLAGLNGGFEVDTRARTPQGLFAGGPIGETDSFREKVTGLRVTSNAFYRPPVWDVESSYGGVDGVLAGYVGSSHVSLAARIGGRRVWGNYPWFDAATIGGFNNRGFHHERFAGDTSAFAGVELSLWAAQLNLPVFPVRLGIFGFGDTGRVWLEGETSDRWHNSYGGGVLLQPLATPFVARARIARSREDTLFYLGTGLGF